MSENNIPSPEDYIRALESSNRITRKAVMGAISELGFFDGCNVLDVPCGIGNHDLWMVDENPNVNIVGMDFSEDHIDYARKQAIQKGCPTSVIYESGDINDLRYEDNSFDFVWCCDGIWPGPPETGCLCEQPYDILKEFSRITKTGGVLAILFWSSQKLLPGYPLLEAALNNTSRANIPFNPESNPELHFMKTPLWLKKTGLGNIQARTFVSDIQGPLSPYEKESLSTLFNMFWGGVEAEVPAELWTRFRSITDPQSDDYILNREDYSGFITYTLFTGEVKK